MHRDVGVCSIGHDELTGVLLLRQQRGHAVQPAQGLWNGRAPGVSLQPRVLPLGPGDAEARSAADRFACCVASSDLQPDDRSVAEAVAAECLV